MRHTKAQLKKRLGEVLDKVETLDWEHMYSLSVNIVRTPPQVVRGKNESNDVYDITCWLENIEDLREEEE